MSKRTTTVKYRRKREGKTDYRKRLSMLQTHRPRLVVRKSLQNMVCQIVGFESAADKVLVCAHSSELKKYGWKYSFGNVPAAYLSGFLLGVKALQNNVKEAIVDLGLQAPVAGSRLYAVVKGVVDAGLGVPCDKGIFPSEERITGKHIVDYANALEGDKLRKQFSVDVKDMCDTFKSVKQKITELKK